MADAQVPSGVNVPMCSSMMTWPAMVRPRQAPVGPCEGARGRRRPRLRWVDAAARGTRGPGSDRCRHRGGSGTRRRPSPRRSRRCGSRRPRASGHARRPRARPRPGADPVPRRGTTRPPGRSPHQWESAAATSSRSPDRAKALRVARRLSGLSNASGGRLFPIVSGSAAIASRRAGRNLRRAGGRGTLRTPCGRRAAPHPASGSRA